MNKECVRCGKLKGPDQNDMALCLDCFMKESAELEIGKEYKDKK